MESLTPAIARQLLERHDLKTRKSLGQHFLVDPNTVRKIVRLAGVGRGDTIVEIGPGLGSLTLELARACRRVIAVELDAHVAAALADVVGGLTNVEIVVADAVKADLDALAGGRARLVSNLPYSSATPILAHVLDDAPSIAGGLVMAQRELGRRWTAPPGSRVYGSISVKVAYHADARVVGHVAPTVFLPPPKVDSVLVAFERKPAPVHVDDPGAFFGFVESAFSQRRKTLRNALRGAGHERGRLESALSASAVDGGLRPEQLGLADFAGLFAALREAS